MASGNQAHHRGYSLGTLFLLIAACAVVIGMVTPVLRGDAHVGAEELIGSSISCGIVSLIIGGLVGLFHYSRPRGVGWGVIVGGLIGLVCGPIMFVPPKEFSFFFSTAVGGAVLIVGVAAVIRLTSSDPPTQYEHVEDEIVTAVVVRPKRHPLDP